MAMPIGVKPEDLVLNFEDFPHERIIRIEGINYSYELFKAFGVDGFPIGTTLKIIKRDSGMVAVERLCELEEK